jgi:hypothetical protein
MGGSESTCVRKRGTEGEGEREREYLVSDDGTKGGPDPEAHVGVVVYIYHHIRLVARLPPGFL